MKKIKHDSTVMKLIVIIGIVVLPLVYSLFYLKGFWDPYNSLDKVPVALVNLDKCENACTSDELIDTLKTKKSFDFKEVGEKEADKGLIDEKYYAIIKIPEDFTSSLENADKKDRKQPEIIFTTNTKSNYIMSQVIGMGMKEIKLELQGNIDKEIVSTLTESLQSVPNQMDEINDGFQTIHNGTTSLVSGGVTLKNGINTITTNYKDFDNGINKLYNGSNTLYNSYKTFDQGLQTAYDGSKKLKDSTDNLEALTSKVTELKTGSDAYTSALNTYKENSDNVLDNTTNVYNKLIGYVESNPNITDQNILEAYQIAKALTTNDVSGLNAIGKLKYGTDNLVSANQLINGGINQFAVGVGSLGELKTGIDSLEAGLATLKTGSNDVYNGINTLNNGLASLSENSTKINNGLGSINNGTTELVNGATKLNNGVGEAKTTIDGKITETENKIGQLKGIDNYSKEPVKIKEEAYGDVNDYGTFFSPYFMSLSLWVGGILILMGLYYDPDHRFKTLGRESNNRAKRLVYYNIIGIIQAIMLGLTLQVLLDFEITNILLYYGSCILISEAFLAIIMFLFFNFKDVGKFLALVFLVLQLASCGGTFPIETEPGIYQAIYPFMPMTYSVDLLRESFVNINSNFLIKDCAILFSIFVIFNLLIFVTGLLKNKKENEVTVEIKKTKKNKSK